ncbi:MAG: hypothetical protein ACLFTK_00725 [Anaerolineales bacterium]
MSLFLLLVPGLLAFRPAQQAEELQVEVLAGVGGWYRSGDWLPLQVRVESSDTTIQDGLLQVRIGVTTGTATQFETTYQTDFSIAPGENRREFLYISLDDFTRDVQVEIVNNEGDIVTRARADIQQLDYADVLYGVITDATVGIIDVARYRIGRGRSYQVNWSLEDIPPDANGFRALDALIITDTNTSGLSVARQEALREWVASGGHLIVTGGTNWQRTTSGLVDLLPAEPTETVTLDDVRPLGEFVSVVEEDREILENETLVAASTPRENAEVLLAVDGTPLVVRHMIGNGTVDFVTVDATTEPVRTWGEFSRIWRELLISAEPRPSWSHGIERFTEAQNAISNVTGFDLPQVLQLLAFLVAYIALIGPINYWLLNAFGRRELAWLTIPALIVAFSAFAYLTGFSLRGDAVTVNQLSVIQVWDDAPTARVDGMVGIVSPRRTSYDVIIQEGLHLRSVPNTASDTALDVTIRQGENDVARDIPVDAAIMATFATSGYIEAPALEGSAVWQIRGENVLPRVTGEVTNGLDAPLEDAIILAGTEAYEVGDLGAGESASFSLNVALDQPARQPLGTRVDPARPVLYPQLARSQRAAELCYPVNGPNLVYTQVMEMHAGAFSCTSGGDDREIELRRRALLVAAMNNEIDLNGGRATDVFLLGWGPPPLDVTIAGVDQLEDGSALYIYEIPARIDITADEPFMLPVGLMNWSLIETDQPNRLPEINADLSIPLLGEQGAALRFTPMPDVPLEDVASLRLEAQWRIGIREDNVAFSLWNWDEAEWQEIEMDFVDANQTITEAIIDDPAYIGPQQAVQVLVEGQDIAGGQVTIQRLNVTLRGTE